MNRGPWVMIRGPWIVNRGPWNSTVGTRNLYRGQCSVIMRPSNVNKESWNLNRGLGM